MIPRRAPGGMTRVPVVEKIESRAKTARMSLNLIEKKHGYLPARNRQHGPPPDPLAALAASRGAGPAVDTSGVRVTDS
jgi:hypothetical protein